MYSLSQKSKVKTGYLLIGFQLSVSGKIDYDPIHFTYIPPAFTCSKLTIETLEQGVEYVQS